MNKLVLFTILCGMLGSSVHAQSEFEAERKAIHYLNKNHNGNSYNLHMLAKWLSRKYDMEIIAPENMIDKPLFDDDITPFNFYNKLLDRPNLFPHDSLISTYQKSVGLERVMLWGANADVLPLDTLNKLYIQGFTGLEVSVRQVAHVAIAMLWAQQVSDNFFAFLAKMKPKLETRLLIGESTETKCSDSWLEAVLGLICLNRYESRIDEWVEIIKSKQSIDGGWNWNGDNVRNSKSHPHTTLLALWVLLEHQN